MSFWQGKGKVIGVVQDFHLTSLHETIRPLVIVLMPKYNSLLLVKAQRGRTPLALAGLQQAYRKYNPGYPFEYHFLDETFERQYKSETLVGELAKYFSILAVFISCLGLFGLAAFTAEQRTKEIGIRKVLGASVADLVALLSKEFIKLVGVAFVLASPLAWYAVHQWLQKFAYREEIAWWVFVLAGGLAVLIAVLTVSFQSLKVALANPVKSLRSE
jgi:ABC-type antimicrobial peptide transport system permease subunit